MRKQTATTAIALTALIANSASADSADGYGHMIWGGGMGVLGGLMMLAFWGGIIALIIFVVRRLSDSPNGANGGDALQILRDRFARGEIDEEEFERRKAVLDT
jgi:putative membrane protein